MKNRFLRTLYLPALVALPVILVIVYYTDADVDAWKLIIEETEELTPFGKRIYSNIDGQAGNERLRAYNLPNSAAFLAYVGGKILYEAWILPGFWTSDPQFILEDLNDNGVKELYALTLLPGDSLVLNRIELEKRNFELDSRFIARLERHQGKLDQNIGLLGTMDLTGDGHSEVLVQVSGGFTLQPRAIYAWDMKKDTLLRSPFSGANLKYTTTCISEVGKDGQPFLYTHIAATDNYHEPIAFSDTASWSIVYTSGLNYAYEPRYMGGPQSYTQTFPSVSPEEGRFVSIVYHRRRSSDNAEFHLMDVDGNILRTTSNSRLRHGHKFFSANGHLLLDVVEGEQVEICEISKDLELETRLVIDGAYRFHSLMNVDADPETELVFFAEKGRSICIVQDNLRDYSKLDFEKELTLEGMDISMISRDENKSRIYLHNAGEVYFLTLTRNRLYAIRFLYYFLLYASVTSVMVFLQWLFSMAARRRYEREENLLNYQLQSVMNQLNPHFTFNAINSIGDAIMGGRKEEAFEYFTKLSDLIRKSMKNAIQPFKTLQEEIDFVREYLEIESYRFGERLNWKLEIDPAVDTSILVPKMLIHIFAENSIKHGIFHLDTGGSVHIHVRQEENSIMITISDDGVGFERAFEIEGYRGEGLQIMDNYIKLYNRQEKHSISYEIINLGKTGELRGTRIRLTIT